jgi:hypothetical protein
MPALGPRIRSALSLCAGTAVGFVATWATVQAAALLPGLELTSPGSGEVVSGVVTLSAMADAAGLASIQFQVSGSDIGDPITSGACATSWDTRTVGDGVRTITAIGRDSLGNSVSATPILVTVLNVSADLSGPSVAISSPAEGASVSGTVTLTASASDNTGVAAVWFTVDGILVGAEDGIAPYTAGWSTAGVTNGPHVLVAYARDSAGNDGTSLPVTVTVANQSADSIAPNVALTAPANGSTISGFATITAAASDNVGVIGVQFQLDGASLGGEVSAAPYALSWNTGSTANGAHVLRAVARDAAGNRTTSAAVNVTVSNIADPTPPTVSLTAPAAGATISGTTTISASASDNIGVAGVRFIVDGATVGTEDTSSPFSIVWNSASVANGSHVLRAIARDAAGNTQTSLSRTITTVNAADTVAPSVSIGAPNAAATVSGSVMVSASASDNTGVVGVQFKLDGTNLGAEDLTTPYTTAWSSNLTLNGTHTLTAVARDAAGNSRTSAAVTVTVDNRGTGVLGDFNGDGVPDLVFESTSGQLFAWFLNNGALSGGGTMVPGAVQPAWQVAAIDDFNGDGRSDLLWQNTATGRLYIWLMDGLTLIGGLVPASAAPEWKVVGTGDFNGDGRPDILWRHHVTGQLYVWFMNGETMVSGGFLNPQAVDPVWLVRGVGDFNGDGRPDVIWQNGVNGQLFVSMMNGLDVIENIGLTPGTTSPDWRLSSVADYDGDGYIDLIWQHSVTGQLHVWYLHGTTMTRESPLTPDQVATSWQIVGGR